MINQLLFILLEYNFRTAWASLLLTGIIAAVFVVFFHIEQKISHSKKINSIFNDYEKQVLEAKIEMQEQTFQNLSADIHDNIGQKLTLAKFQVMRFGKAPDIDLKNVETLLDEAITDLRTLSHSLSSVLVTKEGLVPAIEYEIDILKKTGSYAIDFVTEGESGTISTDKELIIYRIWQEAVQNIIKHANANAICVNLKWRNDWLIVEIIDNGTGMTNENLSGTGMQNMKMRAAAINATFSAENTGDGTILTLKIPVTHES